MRSFKRQLCIVLLILFNQAAFAATHFDSGVSQFQQKNYQGALKYFLLEQKAGNDSAQLWFNLASVYVKLGKFNYAKDYYSRLLTKPDWDVIGRFYLAIVAEKTNDAYLAEKYFSEVALQQSHKKLQAAALRRLASKYKKVLPEESNDFMMLSIIYGIDSNPIAISDAFQIRSADLRDSFNDLMFFTRVYPVSLFDSKTYFQGYVTSRQHSEFGSLDTTTINTGMFHENDWDQWRLTKGLELSWNLLDGKTLYSQVQLVLDLGKQVNSVYVNLRFLPSYFSSPADFQYLNGTQQQVQLQSSWNFHQTKLSLAYWFETNDREGIETPDNRFSYSPTRHSLQTRLSWTVNSDLLLNIGASFTSSVYDGEDRLLDTDDEFKQAQRKADLLVFEISGEYKVTPQLTVTFEYEQTDNQENFELYTFDRNEMRLGIRYQFAN